MNKVMFIGRTTKDIEVKKLKENNKYVTTFRLAVNRGFLGKNGEKLVDFIPIVAWDKNAELLAKYTKKGSRVNVIGRLQIKSYETRDGVRKYMSEVVAQEIHILDWKNKEQEVG
ncbi:single-stranded DNA-binding protein [Clostridium botulinum]|uniref:Single-stranded DNA-binding protein n=1 Tax=Clostridium botulinum TaxID=1491 RepID=A0A9Q1V084_CLOBO|nr:single-stranded DNA-binding protein [Clostridium botulinum]AEB75419.1 Single-strand binding protein family [Clostridium botulinum BKT015925]KEH99055.1 single-stranded DNA-binding protein [Clostridium botulinum D str. 16868]KEI01183.1 single-stranded DNA-binding protein [Clostridium botulinum C/D str. Sp77]KLU76382.1 single-stranded DNA-binding protein [Clostridium botulinum V891]KOA73187.1 single-stranded DNA-binding protein [Clostridium botulinum]